MSFLPFQSRTGRAERSCRTATCTGYPRHKADRAAGQGISVPPRGSTCRPDKPTGGYWGYKKALKVIAKVAVVYHDFLADVRESVCVCVCVCA